MQIDEADIAHIAKGTRAYVTAPAFPGKKFGGAITDVSPRLGAKTIQTGAPTEKRDASVLDVLVTLDPGRAPADRPAGRLLRSPKQGRNLTPQRQKPMQAAFIQGSILRHVVVMTATSSIGLMAIF